MADVGKVAVQERYGSGWSSPVEWCNRFVSFGLGTADSSPGNEGWQPGMVVVPYGRSGRLPEGSSRKGLL